MQENTNEISANENSESQTKKRGNPAFHKGMKPLNPLGRPREIDAPKMTNRELREKAFMELVRKLKPYQSKAIQAAVKVLDNNEAADQNKLKASALIISTYRDLLKDLYDRHYDTEAGEEIQENNQPVFSLKMIEADDKAA